MSSSPGVYSIIQYVPSAARGEGVNVGVLIACPTARQIAVRLSESNELVKRRFGAASFDDARLTSAKRALARRLQRISSEPTALEDFISREAGSLVVQAPRPMVVDELSADLGALFDELVGEHPARRRSERASKPQLASYFQPLFLQNVPIQADVRVTVPVLGKELRADYAYRNGTMNYIKAQGFGTREETVLETAGDLGIQGRMLATHDEPETNAKRRLIVVGRFAREDMAHTVEDLLEACSVTLVPDSEVPSLVARIRAEAHA